MSGSEQTNFIRYLSNRNKRTDTRNVDLFKSLIQNREEVIRNEIGVNAYNVLSKRLYDRLLDFNAGVALEQESTEEVSIMKLMLMARKLFNHDKFKLAYKILNSSEKKAIQINHYSLLNEIYHTYIQYSYHELSPEQEELIKKFEINKKEFVAFERLNMAQAVIQKAFLSANKVGEALDLNKLVIDTYERFNISDIQGYNFQALYQIAQIADVSGAYNKDYYHVNLFFEEQVLAIGGSNLDTNKYLIYHIDVLYLLANIHFRKRNFEKSMFYLDLMQAQMKRMDSRYYQSRVIQHHTLLALNLNFTRKQKEAVSKLNHLLELGFKEEELLNLKLALMMIYFQQNDLKAVKNILVDFNKTDSWYESYIGIEWALNKNYMEILLHIELGDIDYVDSRMSSLVRRYKDRFKLAQESQVLRFLKLVKEYYQQPELIASNEFKLKVERTLEFKAKEEEDIFIVCFYAWLKAKMVNEPVYQTTLELLESQ
jgi:hypothetical protein